MQKRQFLQSALVASIALSGLPTRAQMGGSVDSAPVVRHYSAQVYATYQDTLSSATEMHTAIKSLLAAPSPESLAAARKTWLAAREWYLQTEAFRFYGGPIDDDRGLEGRINSWPMDESYVDYVVGKPNAGLINDRRIAITKASPTRTYVCIVSRTCASGVPMWTSNGPMTNSSMRSSPTPGTSALNRR